MGFEIERKFLVSGDDWRDLVIRRTRFRQAYMSPNGNASIRVRITDNRSAALTIKSRGAELRRLEFEYSIPIFEGESLISLRSGSIIEKERHIVPYKGATWEIDVFACENEGLVSAEVELRDEQQQVELPPWIGVEVTGQAQYYSGALARRPFSRWPFGDRNTFASPTVNEALTKG
jgi:adenylate cyclase